MQLLKGCSLDELSRELKVSESKLAYRRDDFLEAGKAELNIRPTTPEAEKLERAQAKIGGLTMKPVERAAWIPFTACGNDGVL